MNQNQELIQKFYIAFANQDSATMASCYHKNIQFQDPAFGILIKTQVPKMWQMLIERSKGNIKIEFSDIIANDATGFVTWIATYNFSKTNRKVINTINASFEFKEGLIIKHTDHFDLWKWSSQAFGMKGLLLGWTPYMQQKIRKQARLSLEKYEI